jgi:hypothetical protein
MLMSEAPKSPAGRAALLTAGAQPMVSAAGVELKAQCQVGAMGAGIPYLMASYANENQIAIRTALDTHCYPRNPADPLSLKAFEGLHVTVTLCLLVDDDPVLAPDTLVIKCQRKSEKHPTALDPMSSEAIQLCRPGTNYYWARAQEKSSSPGFTTAKGTFYSNAFKLGCNEAGAWRRMASRNGRAGDILGNSMLNRMMAGLDYSALPQGDPNYGDRHGWQAHHIIPADYGRGSTTLDAAARTIQALGYTCDIDPNSAVNGVWLRGPRLYIGAEGYKYLTDFGRQRPAHRPIHTTVHFDWVKTHLDNNATSQGTCLSVGGMYSALRRMRDIIEAGDAPK